MSPSFRPRACVVLVLALAACRRSESGPPGSAATLPAQAEMPRTLTGVREHPSLYDASPEEIPARQARHLVDGSQEAVQFAKQQLSAAGEKGIAEVLRVMEPLVNDPGRFGALVNGCQALTLAKAHDERSLGFLRAVLRHPSGAASSEAARSLGYLGDASSFPYLRDRLAEAPLEQKKLLIESIGRLQGSEADGLLLELAKNTSLADGFRRAAIETLGSRPLATAEPHLRALLASPTPAAEIATIALVSTRDPAILERARALAAKLEDPRFVSYARLATAALAAAGEPEAAYAALRSANPALRLDVGLVALRASASSLKPNDPARTRLLAALRGAEGDSLREVRLEAARILVSMGETPSVDGELADLAAGDADRVSDALVILTDPQVADRRATAALGARLEAAPFSRKRGFAQALGRVGDPTGARFLAPYLTGPSEFGDGSWFHAYAALQLANLGEVGARHLVAALAETRDPLRRHSIARGLAACAEPRAKEISIPALRRLAETPGEHPEVRAVAVRILPALEGNAAAPFLKRLLASEGAPEVRRLLNATLWELY